ncbi:MAG: signal peptidase I [Elusimicrobia bacterium RIFOXYB2_FULL_62_6]|nr:MAG: signal peptidase I [Elusimicrobia bacterium RIFOXYB2_FULL_62_6]
MQGTKLSRVIVITVVTISVLLLVRKFAYEPMYIASESMLPTLYRGQHLLMDKLVFRFRDPARGEIIIFASPAGGEHESVKRVIAVAGDTVEIKSKEVFLNGEKLLETYARHTRPDDTLDGDNLGPLTVPEGALFVLGDNRDESMDSATWKDPATGEKVYFLKREAVTGRIRGIY